MNISDLKEIDLTVKTYLDLAEVYMEDKRYDEAISRLNATIGIKPDCSEAYFKRGVAYYYKGENDKAIKDYDMTIAFDPKHVQAYVYRGNLQYNKWNFNEAIRDYSKALDIDPECHEAYLYRAETYKKMGKTDNGRKREHEKMITQSKSNIRNSNKRTDVQSNPKNNNLSM